ncbi:MULTISPECIES: M15 family metallopeptidase [Sellimonas]|nr:MULTISPECIES: M15 family metallopeptidase [Sellimonas]
MKKETKDTIRMMHLLILRKIRRMKSPIKTIAVMCAVALLTGLFSGAALGRMNERKKAQETIQKEVKSKEKIQEELDAAKGQLEAHDEDTRPWYLMLVNQSHPMEEGYVPELADIDSSHQVDARILEPLQKMLSDAEKAGHKLYVCSAYRSVERQKELFNESMVDYVNQGMSYYEAAVETAKSIAWPGESEHATGLAMDIVSANYAMLDEKQGETKEQQWLMEHCYDYGFILRYPKDKMENTGIIYEPWHYRYVGVEDAKKIQEMGVTLEEYLNEEY